MDVKNRFDALGPLDGEDVESSWRKLSGASVDAGNSVIGYKKEIKQPWMTSGTFKALQLKADAINQGLIQERRRLQGVFNAKTKLEREAYFKRLADEAQLGILQNNLRPAYNAVRCLSGKRRNSGRDSVFRSDENQCSSAEEILQRWQEHFYSMLNFPLQILAFSYTNARPPLPFQMAM